MPAKLANSSHTYRTISVVSDFDPVASHKGQYLIIRLAVSAIEDADCVSPGITVQIKFESPIANGRPALALA